MSSSFHPIEVTKTDLILETLSTSQLINLTHFDVLIFCGGGQTRSYFAKLKNDQDVEVLWTAWCGPKWSLFLSFIPGQAGLIKIKNQNRIKSLFEEAAVSSVSDFYYVRKELTEKITHASRTKPPSHNGRILLKGERSFIHIQAEMDETTFVKGAECYLFDISFGPGLDEELKSLLMM